MDFTSLSIITGGFKRAQRQARVPMIAKMFLINTFIDGLFTGGQALVVIMRHRSQTPLLQSLAWELKAPVTAYVLPYQEGFAVRYFSATGELNSGGYASLAVAKALYFAGLAPPDQPLRLDGLNGQVLARPSAGPEGGVSLVLPPAPAEPLPPDRANDLPEDMDQDKVLGLLEVGPYRLICLAEQPEALITSKPAPHQSRVVLSWPLDKPGYGLRCFGAAGEEAELPVDLDFHATLAPFWGRQLGWNQLEIHHLAHRQALLRAELTAGEVGLGGQLQIVYSAAPATGELIGDDSLS